MQIIDFNHSSFKGFQQGEDILLDTGILMALSNQYDAYSTTVRALFTNHILKNNNNLFLYVNPTIVNEVTFLADRPLKNYLKANPQEARNFDQQSKESVANKSIEGIKELIEQEVLIVLDGDKESTLHQIDMTKALGAADALNTSIANLYGTSFLTVDYKLAQNLHTYQSKFPNIKSVYFTTGANRTYR
ncbi:hypothetical protein [Priestia koreensis]|uniref:hypothetical protein n=1 Tax=Priestia koreensis TaxID=284581 RepID=UPI00301AF146